MRSNKLKIINLYGAAGTGKSGIRGGLFFLMKSRHQSVEEVSEYAKYLVLADAKWQLTHEQSYIFSQQHHGLLLCERNGLEYAITDSPLHLCPFYSQINPQPEDYSTFEPLVDEAYSRYENINIFLSRDLSKPGAHFDETGRVHSRDDNPIIETKMRDYLARKGIPYLDAEVNSQTPWFILDTLLPQYFANKSSQ